jgi:hypothetical protein
MKILSDNTPCLIYVHLTSIERLNTAYVRPPIKPRLLAVGDCIREEWLCPRLEVDHRAESAIVKQHPR